MADATWSKKINIPLKTVILAFIISVSVFVIVLDMFKQHRASVQIIIVPRSETAASQIEEIVQNAIVIPQTISFYDRMVENGAINDFLSEFPSNQKTKVWKNSIDVRKVEKSGSIIKLTAYGKTSRDSEVLVIKSSQTLFSVMSSLYDTRNDLNLRIIEDPAIEKYVPGLVWVGLGSIIVGFIGAFILNFVFDFLGKLFKKKKETRNKIRQKMEEIGKKSQQKNERKEEMPYFEQISQMASENIERKSNQYEEDLDYFRSFEKNIDSFAESLEGYRSEEVYEKDYIPQHEKQIEKQQEDANYENTVYPNFPEMPQRGAKKSSAPENLPVAEEDQRESEKTNQKGAAPENLPFAEDNREQEKSSTDSDKKEMNHEPSEEEYKRRLNQLLKGQM